MGLELHDVTLVNRRETWLRDISIEVDRGITVLLGPTLAGKTTLMRTIAGLVPPTSGRIVVNGEDVTGQHVRKRSVAMVYQQFINYPSLTVFDNIASPLTLQPDTSRAQIRERVEEVAEMLQITPYLDRRPEELSGGQQQRCAIARALARRADVLLLDEPLANLDYKLRESLRADLQRIFADTEMVVLYSTAEAGEALGFDAPTVVMGEGQVLQTGHALDIYLEPADVDVARAMSDPPINLIDGHVDGDGVLSMGGAVIELPGHMAATPEGPVAVGIQPHLMSLQSTGPSDVVLTGEARVAELTGGLTFLHVDVADTHLVVSIDGPDTTRPGTPVELHLDPADLLLFAAGGHGRLLTSPDTTAVSRG